jgi:hypothetical protein
MKTGSRPQYYRIRRMVQMVREGAETGYLANSSDFMKAFEVSRRTVARDLDFLRDEERAPLAYDDARHGFRLADETYTLPPVRISRKEAFSFGLARKLLAHYEGTPLHLDMRSVLDKIAESLEGDVTIEPDWLSEHVGVEWVQFVPFVEVGRVAPHWNAEELHEDMQWSGGVGLRVWAKGIVGRLDTAFSEEGAGIQMMISHPFQF